MSIELPSKLDTIYPGAFDQCYRLVEILNYADKLTDKLEDNFPFRLRVENYRGDSILSSMLKWDNRLCTLDKTLVNCFDKDFNVSNVLTIDIDNIASYALYKTEIQRVELNVKTIGDYAFFNSSIST